MRTSRLRAGVSDFRKRRRQSLFAPSPVAAGMPDKDGDAVVTPDQPWTQSGTASVAPLPPFPDLTVRTLPLVNRLAGTFTVRRTDYPLGVVEIPKGHEPATSPATLPIIASSGDSVQVTGDLWVEYPDGFVIWFLAQ